MGIKSTSHSGYAVGILTLSCLLACAAAPRLHLQHKGELQQADVEKIVAENPLVANDNIKVTTVGQGESVSHHVVQVRDREAPRSQG